MSTPPAPAERAVATELFTDLYELSMLRAYVELGMTAPAVFSLFVRKLPPRRNYLIACGIDGVLDTVAKLRFGKESLDHLATLGPAFPDRFLRWLEGYRFTGAVHAVPEGTPVFANEPILEVVAPIAEAQLLETLIMNQVGLETVLCSKAARVVEAAEGRPVVDFGSRRAHGYDAALKGARAFHIAGVAATSNVLAAARHGLRAVGTVAHSFIEAFASEAEAFRRFAEIYPGTTLLVDTYDTLDGVRKVTALAKAMGARFTVRAVRLDSGDLGELAKGARRILDAAGLQHVEIFASGGLDEDRIAALLADGAPIDGFGVGTDMSVSADAPALDIVYKLTAYAGEGRLKLSSGKRTLPGRKQVYRSYRDGVAAGDVIARAEEDHAGEPLLLLAMTEGRPLAPGPAPLDADRDRAAQAIARLPEAVRALTPASPPYPVTISDGLVRYEAEVRERIAGLSQAETPAAE